MPFKDSPVSIQSWFFSYREHPHLQYIFKQIIFYLIFDVLI